MKSVSAAIFSAPTAAEIAKRKTNQNATEPIRCDGRLPGLTRSTYLPASELCRARSTPVLSRILLRAVLTSLATM
jgi:hypothetical protein